MTSDTERRKDAHLALALGEEVEPAGADPLFDEVLLVHDALPELAEGELDTGTDLCGKRLRLPLVISGMTGGTDRAGAINRDLARLAEEAGCAFGVGSQRAMAETPALGTTYQVRDEMPTALLLANLGGVQAARMGPARVLELVRAIDADGLCVHLNPAQELSQPEGDRDFRGVLEAIGSLARELGERLVVKETGAGISARVAARLWDMGVRVVDVAGLGGTSWARVESLRAAGAERAVGEALSRWGLPTAACVAAVRRRTPGMKVIASGGVRDGLDVARALALGAHAAGLALPLLRARETGGLEGARACLDGIVRAFRAAMLLVGARDLPALREKRPRLGPRLSAWVDALLEEA